LSDADLETRDANVQEAGTVIRGYAARFDSPAIIAGEFTEQIAPGAFAVTLRRGDVIALLAHDYGRVLGRQSAGTLRLKEDALGLAFELDADLATPSGQEAFGTVKRRDIRGCSFGFRVRSEDWTNDSALPLRTIKEIELYEISLLANPAYDQTTAWISQRASNGTAAARRIAGRREMMRQRGML
jgi:HK97 family phage prohead protease